jgi:hypothetical protein
MPRLRRGGKAYVDPKLDSAIEIEMAQERQHEWLDEARQSRARPATARA